MSSYLETVPYNVLCHIAYLSASSCVLAVPSDVLRLMLTSRTIYHTLAVSSCPHLYADLFRVKFDIAAHKRRMRFPGQLTSSSLSAELVRRYGMLRHVRLGQVPSQVLLAQDLFTAYMMILESDGLNEKQLEEVHFSEYATTIVRNRLSRSGAKDLLAEGIDSLAMWTMWLTLSPREYINFFRCCRLADMAYSCRDCQLNASRRTKRVAQFAPTPGDFGLNGKLRPDYRIERSHLIRNVCPGRPEWHAQNVPSRRCGWK
jgi:hypothetical protein